MRVSMRYRSTLIDKIESNIVDDSPPFFQIITETLPALQKLKQQGLARHVGITGLPLDCFTYVLDRQGFVCLWGVEGGACTCLAFMWWECMAFGIWGARAWPCAALEAAMTHLQEWQCQTRPGASTGLDNPSLRMPFPAECPQARWTSFFRTATTPCATRPWAGKAACVGSGRA